MHATVYSIMAFLLLEKKNLEEAKHLYKSALVCCLRVLGPNHVQTAEVYMDYGRLYLRMDNKEEALIHFEKAYLIYDATFGKSTLETASAAF